MVTAAKDTECLVSDMDKYKDEIGSAVKVYEAAPDAEADHSWFLFAMATAEMMDILKSNLEYGVNMDSAFAITATSAVAAALAALSF